MQPLTPSLDDAVSLAQKHAASAAKHQSLYLPVYSTQIADLLTPVTAYLKVADHAEYSFLFESVEGGEKIGRYSFLGANPREILVTGEGKQYRVHGDPLIPVEHELDKIHFVPVDGIPSFTGGAVGFVTFDCVKYFEPRTARALKDTLGIPEAMFLYMDTIVVFDHLHHTIKAVSHIKLSPDVLATGASDPHTFKQHVESEYRRVHEVLSTLVGVLNRDHIPLPTQQPIPPPEERAPAVSNVGEAGYKNFVKRLKHHIVEGDIFQAVPSQRLARPTALHPFNAYRQLRSFNPSPYLFYLDVKDFQIVGASPEMLVKVEDRKVYTHPIAGTRKRGKTPEEDEALGRELLADPKERAEHIMLVDLGRNDCNRICEPESVCVESLMHIERYSHVMHIVSVVSGTLRPEQNQFTAFRSIFPAGTVSGSPKVRAMELIFELEQEKRGIYAGAVGQFDYGGGMNTCIAIRTMVFKDGVAYLQAGGGIVYDSQEEEEFMETVNKMKSSVTALERAEDFYYRQQQQHSSDLENGDEHAPASTHTPPRLLEYGAELTATQTSANQIYKLPAHANTADITVLIDNYDSFVFNVYQYLCMEGAKVLVFRNDQTTVEHIKSLSPVNLVISPGPGKPADSGISPALIREFAGKIPIFGVCLGEQAMYEVFGGVVTYAGEIVHGKTSPIFHDGLGLYRGIPQAFNVTRYHSLAGDRATLPDSLVLTSWTANGLVMGVRHREFTIEGVQYHPESVMSEQGHKMIRNFLQLRGGTWAENDASFRTAASQPDSAAPANGSATRSDTILNRIYKQRSVDVAAAQEVPGRSLHDLTVLLRAGQAPLTVSLYDRLRNSTHKPAVMAEIKRASPSKGVIDISANAALRAAEYASAGAAVISVLTEPTWFKGTLDDLRAARQAVHHLSESQRPAILRKDFLFCRYQVAEARLAGADTVLLIVAMLTDSQLVDLTAFSRMLGMEPLVEVNTADEMQRALQIGAKVIGVNNRNLHTFDVDMQTTSRLAEMVPQDVVLAALSGIWGRSDVEAYLQQGVGAVLVGEALMRAADKRAFMRELWGVPAPQPPSTLTPPQKQISLPLVKICGLRSYDAAKASVDAGSDLLGFIFVPHAKRYTDPSTVRSIIKQLRGDDDDDNAPPPLALPDAASADWFERGLDLLCDKLATRRFLTVGVFQNQPLHEIIAAVNASGVDLVQLHGQEPADLAQFIPAPVIKVISVTAAPATNTGRPQIAVPSGAHLFTLLDSAHGGSGQAFDWSQCPKVVTAAGDRPVPFFLAGGLSVDNVQQAVATLQPVAVDVSSGVEQVDGTGTSVKNAQLIHDFVAAAKHNRIKRGRA
ncbi:anthranilate synthase / indole-3-glycerol phosphate synthase [Sorochytrium milnesiophthora]